MQAIGENEGLTSLRLSGNSMGVQAAQAIAGALASRSHLRRALWSDMFVGRLRNEIPPALVCTLHCWDLCGYVYISLQYCQNTVCACTLNLSSYMYYNREDLTFKAW